MTELTLVETGAKASRTKGKPAQDAARGSVTSRRVPSGTSEGCRADPFVTVREPRRVPRIRLNSSYGLGAFVGVITYLAYGYLNHAWSNWALVAISIFMFLSLPLYSRYSNRIESLAARWTQLETGGRVARYLFQLLDNTLLLWVYVAGEVIDPAALDGIGGFFATAAWITFVSQGGQYLANSLARKGIGNSDHNVVWAIAISVTISALAVSGVRWIQPAYVGISLAFGALIFGLGLMADMKRLLEKQKGSVFRPWI
jgi:hypothetical protein